MDTCDQARRIGFWGIIQVWGGIDHGLGMTVAFKSGKFDDLDGMTQKAGNLSYIQISCYFVEKVISFD